jgi:hypothetical protein
MNAEVASLLGRQAITEALYRYCRACDRADEALMRSCFHPDATLRYGGFAGASSEFCTYALRIITRARVTKHLLANVLIELDGDVARSESSYFAYHRFVDSDSGSAEDNFSGGRYLDRFERRDGDWRIAERVGLLDFERFVPGAERGLALLPTSARTRRYPDDELYATLSAFRAGEGQ